MDLGNLYESKSNHLKGTDIHGKGDIDVVIGSCEVVKFDDGAKAVIGFRGRDKTVVLNKTNFTAISSVYGDDGNNWIGKPVTLFTVIVQNPQTNQMQPAVRIKVNPQATPHQEEPPPPTHEPVTEGGDDFNDIPFSHFERGQLI